MELHVDFQNINRSNPYFCKMCAICLCMEEAGLYNVHVEYETVYYSHNKDEDITLLKVGKTLEVWQKEFANTGSARSINIRLDERNGTAELIDFASKAEMSWYRMRDWDPSKTEVKDGTTC